jgi:hypothetical protein
MSYEHPFVGCCGAQIAYSFRRMRPSAVRTSLVRIEKINTGIMVVILNDAENKKFGHVFVDRGWKKFCHGTVNPVTSNKLYGYAFSCSKLKKSRSQPRRFS